MTEEVVKLLRERRGGRRFCGGGVLFIGVAKKIFDCDAKIVGDQE